MIGGVQAHAEANLHERLAGCSGSPAVVGQPLRPVTLRPPPFAEGSPCQNILVFRIVSDVTARLRHRVYVDRVTKLLSATQGFYADQFSHNVLAGPFSLV